jgi:glycosyltransferase involved in cell wall biosynthesis
MPAMMSKANILHLCQTYPPDFSGGSTVFALSLGDALSRAGYGIHYLCSTRSAAIAPAASETFSDGAVGVTRFGAVERFKRKAHAALVRRSVKDILQRHSISLVHVHSITDLTEGTVHAAQDLRLPVVVTLHEGAWICANLFFENNVSRRECRSSGLLKCAVCMSAGIHAARFTEYLWSIARSIRHARWILGVCSPLYRRVDGSIGCCEYIKRKYDHFSSGTAVLVIASVSLPLRIGALGTFAEHKGSGLLLRALMLLADRYGDFTIDVWGPLTANIPRRYRGVMARAPLVFHGPYDRRSLNLIFASIDVMLHVSTWDTYSTTILEALASRTPVIALRATGTVEMIEDGKNGILIRRNDPRGLSVALRQLMENPRRVSELQANIEPPPPFQDMVRAYEDAYREALNGKWRHGPIE